MGSFNSFNGSYWLFTSDRASQISGGALPYHSFKILSFASVALLPFLLCNEIISSGDHFQV